MELLGLVEADGETDGDILELGDTEGLWLLEGLTLGLCELLGDTEALGL
jgi:hypothetical protein